MAGTPASDRYISIGKKIADFILGFFGFWIVNVSLYLIFMYLATVFRSTTFFFGIFFLLILLIDVLFTIIFLRSKRRYIGIGIICGIFLVFLIPLLVLGACFLAFSGGGFF